MLIVNERRSRARRRPLLQAPTCALFSADVRCGGGGYWIQHTTAVCHNADLCTSTAPGWDWTFRVSDVCWCPRWTPMTDRHNWTGRQSARSCCGNTLVTFYCVTGAFVLIATNYCRLLTGLERMAPADCPVSCPTKLQRVLRLRCRLRALVAVKCCLRSGQFKSINPLKPSVIHTVTLRSVYCHTDLTYHF